ncbi:sialyltransferase [Chloropicon primus]|uniref:Sialyltransferase n=1 Tax=Chloropicon primus TaxID=1764295 RepID=A0A5B8MIS1_9CHLO|nr:sialyltransferase [Chloropicon primus]UPQ99551.1 sialyltransferase [Chloropicon primus]|eukprot:QDZ20343.1 sialyltransferase [Chloropicon primus]
MAAGQRWALVCLLLLLSVGFRLRSRSRWTNLVDTQSLLREVDASLHVREGEIEGKELEIQQAERSASEAEATLRHLEASLQVQKTLNCKKEKESFVAKARERLEKMRAERGAWAEGELAAANASFAEETLSLASGTAALKGEMDRLSEERANLVRSIAEAEGDLAIGRFLVVSDATSVETFLRRTGVLTFPLAQGSNENRGMTSPYDYTGSFVYNLKVCAPENQKVLLPKWRGQSSSIGVATKKLRGLIPKNDPFLYPKPVVYESCAVVGNSGLGLFYEHGEEIDAHQAVIRINAGTTRGFEEFVGNRTDIRFVNRMHFGKFGDEVVLQQVTNEATFQKFIDYKASSPNSRVFMVSPELHAHVQRELVMPATNGLFAIMFALQRCRQVTLFGFFRGEDDRVPYHYFDSEAPKHSQRRRDVQEGPMIAELAWRSKGRLKIAEPCNSPYDLVHCPRCPEGSQCEQGGAFPVPKPGFCKENLNSFRECEEA